jgi:hypothetical protein
MSETEEGPGGSIVELFPAEDVRARFVVSMSMARNDLDTTLRDGIRAADQDAQDFAYRVRLATSHLVEAVDSLNAYAADPGVRKLMGRVSTDQSKRLTKARSVVQQVGAKALDTVRNNTFHYPSPKTNYNPTSDEELRDVLNQMSHVRALMHLDHRGEHPIITLSFANEVALALAIAQHSGDEAAARKQYETTSEGAVAFIQWAEALLVTYFEVTGATIGQPEIVDDIRRGPG